MSDLPEAPNVFAKSSNLTTLELEDFCTIGLGIPLDRLHHWEIPQDYDAYRIHTTNNLEFVISGPQVNRWLRKKKND